MNANAAPVDCSPQGFTARLKQCYTFEPAMASSADQMISNMCKYVYLIMKWLLRSLSYIVRLRVLFPFNPSGNKLV